MKLFFKHNILMGLILFGISFSANAEQAKLDAAFGGLFSNNTYGINCASNDNSDYCLKQQRFLIRLRNNVLVLEDRKNKSRFKVNLNDSAEQNLSTSYKDYVVGRSPSLKNLLDSVSVSNHKVTNKGKGLELDVNFNFKMTSIFGWMNGSVSLSIGAELVSADQCEGKGGCIQLINNGAKFSKLETSLGNKYSQSVGLVLDFLFRIASAGHKRITGEDNVLYRVNK